MTTNCIAIELLSLNLVSYLNKSCLLDLDCFTDEASNPALVESTPVLQLCVRPDTADRRDDAVAP